MKYSLNRICIWRRIIRQRDSLSKKFFWIDPIALTLNLQNIICFSFFQLWCNSGAPIEQKRRISSMDPASELSINILIISNHLKKLQTRLNRRFGYYIIKQWNIHWTDSIWRTIIMYEYVMGKVNVKLYRWLEQKNNQQERCCVRSWYPHTKIYDKTERLFV